MRRAELEHGWARTQPRSLANRARHQFSLNEFRTQVIFAWGLAHLEAKE
jgi:hypothetical protein